MRGSARLYLGTGTLALLTGLSSAHSPQVPAMVRSLLYVIAGVLLLAALMKSRIGEACDNATPALRRRYLREFVPAMLGYLVSIFASVWLLRIAQR